MRPCTASGCPRAQAPCTVGVRHVLYTCRSTFSSHSLRMQSQRCTEVGAEVHEGKNSGHCRQFIDRESNACMVIA